MSAYTLPITSALILFPLLAVGIVLPYGIIQYRKYGSISKLKLIILFSFAFYLLCAYFLVILPLPDRSEVAKLTTPRYNLQPFNVVRYFIQTTVWRPGELGTYLPALKQGAFLQPFFNLMLTLPFGFYLRYIWKISLKQVILASFGLSLFFELTQLSGLYFIYPRSYRLFDVDDLMLNTLGGALGYALEPWVTSFLPSIDELNADAEEQWDHVSFWRRFAAWLVDIILLNLIFGLISYVQPDISTSYGAYLIGVLVYFVLLPDRWQGKTVGKAIVKIRIVSASGEKASLVALFWRQLLLFGISIPIWRFLLPNVLKQMQADAGADVEFYLIVLSLIGLFLVCFAVNVLFVIFRKNGRMFYEHWAKVKEVAS